MYYKYEAKSEDGKEVKEIPRNSRHPIIETSDKQKIKIRFADLALSKCTQNGLFKSKFIKMTEV